MRFGKMKIISLKSLLTAINLVSKTSAFIVVNRLTLGIKTLVVDDGLVTSMSLALFQMLSL